MSDLEKLDGCIANWQGRPGALLPLLHDVQSAFGFIRPEMVKRIAEALNLSRAEVHGVVSFYEDFKTEPPAAHVLRVCRAEACQAAGSRSLERFLEDKFEVAPGNPISSDFISIEGVYCFGNCASGPTIELGGRVMGRMTSDKLCELLNNLDD